MSIVPLRPLLEAALEHGFAHGAFNVNAVAQARAVIQAHEMFRSAAIMQGADLANAFMGGRTDFLNGTIEDKQVGAKRIGEAVREFGEDSPIPVVLHLDHGKDYESVKVAIDNGYTSVMIDGSSLSFDENVALTREVVRYAHPRGVTVEGELGVLAGVEDDVFSEKSTYTNPMQVCRFFRETGVDCLAISYGTKHGANKGLGAKIRAEIAIASMENLRHEGIFGALVSHGSSTVPQHIVAEINELGGNLVNSHGISIDQLCAVIPHGIAKINIDTDIRLAVTRNIREFFAKNPDRKEGSSVSGIWKLMNENPDQYDPRVYLPPIMDTVLNDVVPDDDVAAIVDCVENGVREIVGTLIVRFGSAAKAPLVETVTLEQMADRYKKMGDA